MYVYCKLKGGFCDHLKIIQNGYNYCRKFNRTLLIDTTTTCYDYDFDKYFSIKGDVPIIGNHESISEIINDPSRSVYPTFLKGRVEDAQINYNRQLLYYDEDTKEKVIFDFDKEYSEDLLVFCVTAVEQPFYHFFDNFEFTKVMIDSCMERIKKLSDRYISIQIRNTDRICNYRKLFFDNQELLKSYPEVYIATDDNLVFGFFKEQNIKFKNFTTFPNTSLYHSLHSSDISGEKKLIDLVSELCILALSDKILSVSGGGFILLARYLNERKELVKHILDIDGNKPVSPELDTMLPLDIPKINLNALTKQKSCIVAMDMWEWTIDRMTNKHPKYTENKMKHIEHLLDWADRRQNVITINANYGFTRFAEHDIISKHTFNYSLQNHGEQNLTKLLTGIKWKNIFFIGCGLDKNLSFSRELSYNRIDMENKYLLIDCAIQIDETYDSREKKIKLSTTRELLEWEYKFYENNKNIIDFRLTDIS